MRKDDPCYMAFARDGVWLQVTSPKNVKHSVAYVMTSMRFTPS
jgi:hypothetical protein